MGLGVSNHNCAFLNYLQIICYSNINHNYVYMYMLFSMNTQKGVPVKATIASKYVYQC